MSYEADRDPTRSPDPSLARGILIVGGVTGGASRAGRLRGLDESVEIAVLDRGPHVALANCGLPYYVGDVISDERTLLVNLPEMFRERFNIEVRTRTDVLDISTAQRIRSVCVTSPPPGAAGNPEHDAPDDARMNTGDLVLAGSE
jgi:hypothetical protein